MTTSLRHPERTSLSFANTRAEIDRAEEALLEAMRRRGYSSAACFAVRLAVEEAIVNAFVHGHRGLPAETPIELVWKIEGIAEGAGVGGSAGVAGVGGGGGIDVSVTDRGPGFDPATIPDPTLDENIEKTSGRGLMLIRSFMTDVRHELGGRRLVMRYAGK